VSWISTELHMYQYQELAMNSVMVTNLIDVLINPLEQLPLILQAIIQAQRRILSNFIARQEAIRSNSVVEVDHNHVSFGSMNETFAVQVRIAIDNKAASLYENKDGQVALGGGIGRGKYISEETVL